MVRSRTRPVFKRSRFRRLAKWTGACATVLVMLLWTASYFWEGFFHCHRGAWWWDAGCDWGTLRLRFCPSDSPLAVPAERSTGLYVWSHAWQRVFLVGHGIALDSPADRDYYGFRLPKLGTWTWTSATHPHSLFWIRVPLWLLLLVVGVPTGILFWRDRRSPPGHCLECGYNLTGNVSGRCPECGTDV